MSTITLTSGNDTYNVYASSTVVDAGDGNDIINLFGTKLIQLRLYGGAGNDTFNFFADTPHYTKTVLNPFGGALNSYINGGDGDDTFIGNGHNGGWVYGGAGNDSFYDFAIGAMFGGPGNDLFRASPGSTAHLVENPGEGIDTVQVAYGASYTLPDNVENLTVVNFANIGGAATLTGNALANSMTGGSLGETLAGLGGDDNLHGGGGNDTLYGGTGNDTLYGGTGNDTLYGDTGADHFVFNTALSATTNVDQIKDFSVADDTISLSHTIFTQIALGTLTGAAFYNGTSAHDLSDRIIYDSASGNIYYDPDGTGSQAEVLFAHVTAGTGLTNADFLGVS